MSGRTRFVGYTHEIPEKTKEWKWTEDNLTDLSQLADGIERGRVVAYVGAGPSIAAGLDGWNDACKKLYTWTLRQRKWPKEEREFLGSLIKKENFPLFVQIIENRYQDNQDALYLKLREMFRPPGIRPSEAHLAIATLPIPLRITTNYEELLEAAILDLPKAYAPNCFEGLPLTWKDGARLLELVRSRNPGVIKIHGDFSRQDSIILTKNHYRRLAHETAFWSVLKALISTHSFLFIGCSLRDSDVFSLLDEVIEECRLMSNGRPAPARPPMHYALLPCRQANPAFVDHLRSDYGIATFPVPDDAAGKPDLPAVLRLISGEVARRMRITDFPGFGDRPRIQTNKAHLGEIVRVTGSHRGDVVLADDDKTHQLKWWLNWGKDSSPETAHWHPEPPEPTGVISATYAERVDLLYVRDTKTPAPSGVPYMEQDEHVQSELAIPILARGYRIGVLNVESYLRDGYCSGHVALLQQQAALIGSAYLDAEERNQRIRRLQLKDSRTMVEDLKRMYPGAEALEGVLYTADYVAAKLKGTYYLNGEAIPLKHPFQEQRSFAARVFRDCKSEYLNVEDSKERISLTNADRVGLKKGPLFGTPVFDRGLPCAVLVLWGRQDLDDAALAQCGLGEPQRRLLLATTANLMVADHPESGRGLDAVLGRIRDIGGETVTEVYESIARAVHVLGLERLRIWQLCEEEEFVSVVFASPEPHREVIGQKETWLTDSEKAIFSPYSALVKGRYKTDPWARAQGPSMFDLGPDPLASRLQKPNDASWLVAPLVTVGPDAFGELPAVSDAGQFIGYLAADNVPKDLHLHNEKERNRLQCGLSVIAVAATRALQNFKGWRRRREGPDEKCEARGA